MRARTPKAAGLGLLLLALACLAAQVQGAPGAQDAITTTTTSTTQATPAPTEAPNKVTTTMTTITTRSEPITTPAATPSDDEEPLTSVASETIGVDEAAPAATETNDESELGIEGKSISHEPADENSPEDSGKLSIESNGSAEGDEEAAGEEGAGEEASSEQPARRKQVGGRGGRPLPSRLNLTRVDEIFTQGHKEEAETVESWNKMSRQLKKGISGIIGSVIPFALNMSKEARISSNCSGAMLKWVLSMNQLKAWALHMLDASGKPIAGLLEGSMTMFGNYRQCLKIRAPDDDEIEFAGEFREYFRGKYCTIQAKPWLPQKKQFYSLNSKLESLASGGGGGEDNPIYDRTIFEELSEWLLAFNFVSIRFDLCVPSLCSREDIQKAVGYLLQGVDMKARVARCEMDLPEGKFGVGAQVETGSLEVAEALVASGAATTLSAGADPSAAPLLLVERGVASHPYAQLGWIIIPLVALVLVMVATLLSLTVGEDDKKFGSASSVSSSGFKQAVDMADDHDVLDQPGTTHGGRLGKALKRRNRAKVRRTLGSLSLKRSVGSHLNVDYDQLADDKPLALYGLRFLLVLWVILVESAVNLKFEYLRELMMLKDLIFWWPMQFIINSSLQYDSFILLTAFTMAYKNCLNSGTANNKRSITRFVADKYVRLMPSIMLMVALTILLPLVYRGPVWNDYVAKQSAVCQSTGWLNAIFLQNYLPYSEICMPQTWLLCVELQLVLIMAPIVYYLNKSYTASYFGTGDRAPPSDKIATLQSGKLESNSGSAANRDASKPLHWLWTTPGALLMGCVALGAGCSFYNVYSRQLPPSWFYTMADPDSKALYFGAHMTKLWTHLAVFAIGLLGGVECRRAARNAQRGTRRTANISNYLSSSQGALGGSGGGQPNKSHSSSASSLPTILTASGQRQRSNGGSDSGASFDTTAGSSSVSININHPRNQEDDLRLAQSTSSGSEILPREPRRAAACCQLLLDLLGLIIAITIMAALIFATHDWSLNGLPQPLVAGLFDVASRLLWSLAFLWLLYKLSVPQKDLNGGCGGGAFALPARALGHPAMICLGKLSFLIYIIHPFVHTTVLAIQEQPIYSSWLMMFHILVGNITITVILAALISLFVEMPCRNVFRRCGTSLLLTQAVPKSARCAGNCGADATGRASHHL